MIRTFIVALVVALGFGWSAGASAQWLERLRSLFGGDEAPTAELTQEQIGNGLREALRVGTENVVARLGVEGGFSLDPQVHIPLPATLLQVKQVLARVGMDGAMVELESQLNRAAEVATPRARALFVEAIREMTLADVMAVYEGPDDAATHYFREAMSGQLAQEMRPIVEDSMGRVGAARTYDAVMARYNALPLVPVVDADLTDYVVERGIDGIFFYLAREEAAIREDPVKRTTELLRTVFSQ